MHLFCCFANCSEKLESVDAYRIHIRIFHSISEDKKFQCTFPKCNKYFMKPKTLLDHLTRVHKLPKSLQIENSDKTTKKNNLNINPASQSTIEVSQDSEINFESDSHVNDVFPNSDIENILLNFLMDLHSNENLTKELILDIFKKIKEDILDKICTAAKINQRFQDEIDKSFAKLNTQYKFEKRLKENKFITSGINETVSYKVGNVFENGVSVIKEIKENVCLMPIKYMFETIFSIPNILSAVLKNMEKLQNQEDFRNVVNGKRWKTIKKNYPENAMIIPFDLYTDDFETGNALGSNAGAHKIAGYYVSFPTFPQHLLSSTQYIFEVLLFESKLKHDDMNICLEKLIEIFKELENQGIELDVEGKSTTVFFVMTRIIGDNLGLNEVLGFTMSFNANKFCRLCNLSKDQTKKNLHPKCQDLRTPDQYEIDKMKADISSTGVRQDCVFNNLKNFHCTQNFVCDIMHDVYEGVVKYDIPLILRKLIDDKTLNIDLETINALKQNFNYGQIEIGNLSQEITENNMKNCSLKMSASEAKTFLHFLPLMIGSLIPESNLHYNLLLNLVDLSDIIMSSCFNESSLLKLKNYIESYLNGFTILYGHKLKPKHHFLTHYLQCIEQNGPLRFMMTFGYETKNKEVKAYANVSNQRKSLPYSLSTKASMRFNKFIRMHENGFPEETTHQKAKKITWREFKKMKNHEFVSIINNDDDYVFMCQKIIHKKTSYTTDYFIVDTIDCPHKLLKISEIFFISCNYYIIVEVFSIEKFDSHYRSYKAGSTTNVFELISANELVSLPFNLHKTSDGSNYFRLKQI